MAIKKNKSAKWRKRLGRRIQDWREYLEMSRSELGDALGVDQSNVWRWEHGDVVPYVQSLVEMARLCGLGDRFEDLVSTKPPRG